MPNISFDIFFNEDIINLTASRSNGAPKVKPAWKVRSAPKLEIRQAPKPKDLPPSAWATPKRHIESPKPRVTELPESRPPTKKIEAPKSTPKVEAPKAETAPKVENPKAPKLKDTPRSPSQVSTAKKPIPKLKEASATRGTSKVGDRANRFARE
ncbi:MAG: hypothetical protein M1834_007577 [Cirrosporium novae-zelandiae]|nr:MAG: hypothetical protein M1834_007577 [Cirrosporium novae-zelandiae]